MFRTIHILVAALLFPCLLFAQERKYVFTRIAAKDGLASNHVYSIMQDKKGFMWFGTASGLQRYDGRKMVMFRPPPNVQDYLPAAEISQVLEDVHQNFWVRSGKEVGIFDPVTFRYKKAVIRLQEEVPPRSVFFLWPDSRGNIFLVITGSAILAYDSQTNEFKPDPAKVSLPAGWAVNQITEDPKTGNYWMAADSGLVEFDIRTQQLSYRGHNTANHPVINDPLLHEPVTNVFIDRQSRFWITTWNTRKDGQRFYCYDLAGNRYLPDTAGLSAYPEYYRELNRFSQQSNNKLWAYGNMMLFEYNDQLRRFNFIRDEHIDDYGIKYDIIHCAFEDREENLWLGTDEGIYIFNPTREKFNSITDAGSGVPSKDLSILAFLDLPGGNLMAGTWGSGLHIFDSGFRHIPNSIFKHQPVRDPAFNMIWSLHREKRNGKIWIGCQDGRLAVYDPVSQQTTYYNPPATKEKTIRQVTEDANGNIWLSTQGGLLIKWDPQSGYGAGFLNGFTIVQDFNTIVYRVYVDSRGSMWLCTHMKGLYKIDPATGTILEHYDTKKGAGQSLFSDQLSDFLQYNDTLYLVTGSALNIINSKTGQVQQITSADGMPLVHPEGLVKDNEGNIWIGGQNGICRYNLRRNTFTLFTQKDGIVQENFLAGYKLPSGKIAFGSPHGLVFFQPDAVVRNSAPPLDVSITDFKLFNTYLSPDSVMKLDKVRLKQSQNSITIEFAALSFLQRDKIIYFYKLDGIDKDWIRSDARLVANYPLLPPGDYTFMVMCQNADGIASKNITTLGIYIKPPFWRTWWFMSIVILAIAGGIYGIHRLRVNRILAMEKVRTRIARDLHDDMGSTLSTINILSEMAKMKLAKEADKTGEYLVKISDNSTRMMEAMDDIVWSINPMNDSMQRITARMREFATGVLEAKNIDYRFLVDEQVTDIKLDMESRRDLFLLFKEAVNNLAKYSECRQASVELFVQKNKLFLKVQDDGTGFSVHDNDSGNGLMNMKKRAQSLSGKLVIESKLQVGTKVLLEVPLT